MQKQRRSAARRSDGSEASLSTRVSAQLLAQVSRMTSTLTLTLTSTLMPALALALSLVALPVLSAQGEGLEATLATPVVSGGEFAAQPHAPAESGLRSSETHFWTHDVWRDPERPFLFYGDGKDEEEKAKEKPREKSQVSEKEKKAQPPQSLETLTTLEALQAELKARLSRAVMNPTEENMRSYLEANAFLIEKAGVFAESWRATLLQNPAYDWTAQHPTVNFASTELSRLAARRVTEAVSTMASDWGLIFFGDDSELTRLMLPLVEDFSDRHGFETLYVSMVPANPLMPEARLDRGQASRIAGGLKLFPALVLVHRNDRKLENARLAATGVVDIAELGRRLVRLAEADSGKRAATLIKAGQGGGADVSADVSADVIVKGSAFRRALGLGEGDRGN